MKKTKIYPTTFNNQGIALISIVLLTALVLASIVGITATMALTAKRTTSDQMMTLRAQYAAESGLSLAKLRLGELEDVVNLAEYPASLTALDDHALSFCGLSSYTNRPTPSSQWTSAQLINGFELCKARDLDGPGNAANRLSILSDYISKADMESLNIQTSTSKYWDELFSKTLTSSHILQANSEGQVKFDIDYNMQPKAVRLLQDGLSMRFVFGLGNVVATGTILDPSGEIIAARKLELQPNASELYLEVSKPSFAQYGYFADTRLAPSGGQIYFKDGNYIGGRVHINRKVAFSASTTTGGPRFSGKFSTTEPTLVWGSGSSIVNEDLMFLGGSEFDHQEITLPENNHIQRDKALGVNGISSNEEICKALNLEINTSPAGCQVGANPADDAIIADGIYYAAGNGNDQHNAIGGLFTNIIANALGITQPEFFGGIYVQGDVDNIVLDIEGQEQSLLIEHRNGSSVKFYKDNDSWIIEDSTLDSLLNGKQVLEGDFNGLIFVDGKIGCDNRRGTSISQYSDDPRGDIKEHYKDGETMCANSEDGLKGNGTEKPDIQEDFMVTVTATGNVNIKEDITYEVVSQCANQPEDTFNILGVFTPGGNILVDGPDSEHLSIHGAFMASNVGNGFGTLDFRSYKRGFDVNIIMHGSVIHHTDQAVGTFNASTGENVTGYGRKWTFDCYMKSFATKHQRPSKNNHQAGFSLVELLIVIAIIAVVVTLVGNAMRSLVTQTQLREAQSQLVADLTKAKTASVRYSSPVTITFNESSYTLTQEEPFSEQTVSIRNNAKLSFYKSDGSFGTTTPPIIYNNPYGEVSLPDDDQGWQIRVAKGNRDYFVKIVGLTGKVIVNNEQ